ncbi:MULTISPECIES: hypothetical protein [Thermomonospora]|uniref:Uncharacterized protein n=1 Tax=Thermomonospora curvata (strain ATCC 19995 / DSM 43183 / JCM 3096 / KCTC 9072 / NBRC 15933 / NCIMB 10081 / Henssen B9) TaxID=471852 RepID=D1A5R7_THECD|nr:MULTISPECIES: hypothetical protein [Thermomonospora]ACY98212.1 hypothetical protein Tcur_2660 [Thermomonospora curvata DSM 43183]PKK13979.1 MAG: hypothetical protein BUE48_013005 [Thermomonospora sp. CIF 1]
MFQIWESGEPARFVTDAETLQGALDKVDTMCRLRHDQAAAALEQPENGYRFEIRGENGTALATLTYWPDPSRPYESVIVREMGGQQEEKG